MVGVEPSLIEALNELEETLGLSELGSDTPRSFAMSEDNQVDESNILGYGVGLKISNGLLTPIHCVKIYVANKVHEDSIAAGQMPKEVNGHPTDVEQIP